MTKLKATDNSTNMETKWSACHRPSVMTKCLKLVFRFSSAFIGAQLLHGESIRSGLHLLYVLAYIEMIESNPYYNNMCWTACVRLEHTHIIQNGMYVT